MPVSIWCTDLFAEISPSSGVILIKDPLHGSDPHLEMMRKACPNKDAKAITSDELAKLAINMNARMWKAYAEVDDHRRSHGMPMRNFS